MSQVGKVHGSVTNVTRVDSKAKKAESKFQTIILPKGHQVTIEKKDIYEENQIYPTKGKITVFDDNGTPENKKDDIKLKEFNASDKSPIPVDINYKSHKDSHIRIGNTIFKTEDKKPPIEEDSYNDIYIGTKDCKCGPKLFLDLNEKK